MINTYCIDYEVLPNYFGASVVSVNDYIKTFKDIVDDKGNPIPLVQKLTVAEIKDRLASVKKECFYIMDGHDDTVKLASWLSSMRMNKSNNHIYTYNGLRYDNYMAAFFMLFWQNYKTVDKFLRDAHAFSKKIIAKQDDWDSLKNDFQYRACNSFSLPYVDLDVMAIFALNKVNVKVDPKTKKRVGMSKGLKQTSINLQWYELLEYSMPPIGIKDYKLYWDNPEFKGLPIEALNKRVDVWDRYILPEYVEEMKHYNFNDCFIVCEIIRLYSEEIKSRYAISKAYNVNVLNASRSKIGDVMFEKYYSEFSGLAPHQWKGQKTERKKIPLKRVIFPHIKFKTPYMSNILNKLKGIVITEETIEDFKFDIELGSIVYTMGVGGLHSQDAPMEIFSDENTKIIDSDVNSLYPSIMSAYSVSPAHLDRNVFTKLITWMKDTRVAVKHSKDEYTNGIKSSVLALVLKITINAIYGKTNYSRSELYDFKATLEVTINGQLMILMLCEQLMLAGIQVLSANTDGLMIRLRNDQVVLYNNLLEQWESYNKLKMDSEEFNCLIAANVNNYISQTSKGKLNLKGAYDPLMYAKDLSKGYNAPIVPKAVVEYFINKTPIMDTLRNATNVLDFCMTQNVGREWHVEIEYIKDGEIQVEKYQRYVRFYVSNGGVVLKKCHNQDGRRNSMTAGQTVIILNSLDDKDIALRNINYKFYYERCMDMINPIKLGISPKGKGKSKIKKYYNNFNTLFDV